MQRSEVSGAVQPLEGSLGFKGLNFFGAGQGLAQVLENACPNYG